jgi:hypothetical protein
MSGNAIAQFWARQSEVEPLNPEQLIAIKAAFGVVGEIRPVGMAPGYAVTDDGRVFSGILCSWRKDCPRELRQTTTKHGYRMVRLHVNRKAILAGVHVVMARAFLPPPAGGQDRVRHWDGNPANNRLGNLLWGTQAENLADAVRHGRTLKGLKNPGAKLTERRVRLVRELCAEGFSPAAVAAFFGIHEDTVRRACRGKHWGHVE